MSKTKQIKQTPPQTIIITLKNAGIATTFQNFSSPAFTAICGKKYIETLPQAPYVT